MRLKPTLAFLLPSMLFLSAMAQAASPDCSQEGGTLMSWPADEPIWEMCWLPPNQSSGPRGSGLELRAIHYRGIPVAWRIHAPMLFAEYAGSTCYRDWKDTGTPTLAHESTHNQLAIPPDLDRLAATSCSVSQHPTLSYGTCPFQQPVGGGYSCTGANGVVIEDLGDRMRFVSQYRADWYMYDSRVTFYDNGVIEPTFGFGNNNGTFNGTTHWHHNYWRFDFGIDGQSSHVVAVNGVDQSVEFHDLRGEPGSKTWSVRNPDSGRGYELVPSVEDYLVATNESGRGFHNVDFMATRYMPNEYGDNPNYSLGDCGMNQNALVNGQDIFEQDVVLWYRTAVRDATGNNWPPGCGGAGNPCDPQDSMICKTGGPQLVPFGNWTGEPEPEDADLSVAAIAGPDPVMAGEELLFDITVSNAGPEATADLLVELALPPELNLSGLAVGESDWSCSQVAQLVSCSYSGAALAADDSLDFDVLTMVSPTAKAGIVQTVVTVISEEFEDPDLKNNAVLVSTEIEVEDLDTIFRNGFECLPKACP